ncbi:MAG TPA: hypothetical protein P5257_03390 [Bacteroidales bacterium]|nr:hypothetical protein [Bacteroidales bacterium]HRT89140.1 hypothetical protein [Bacteroidales bacterium]
MEENTKIHMKAILCRIGWMNKYNGKDEDKSYDPGGMNWEGKEKYCGEFWNFVPSHSFLFPIS